MRRPLDFYETPEHYVNVLLDYAPVSGRIFEPCVGDGAISRLLHGCETNDIDVNRDADHHFDAAKPWPMTVRFDWIVTNPPFKHALSILEQAREHASNVAMILRISFFEPTKAREKFLVETPPDSIIYLPRYSFTANGKSDMATVLWGIWGYSHWNKPSIQIAPRFE